MYTIRMNAQKAEFCGIWVLLSLNIIAMILRKHSSMSTSNQDSAGQHYLASTLYEISVFYFKASLISRFLVYGFRLHQCPKEDGLPEDRKLVCRVSIMAGLSPWRRLSGPFHYCFLHGGTEPFPVCHVVGHMAIVA